jgi:UV DNA damage repair endonuclease
MTDISEEKIKTNYDKMQEYIESVFDVFNKINNKSNNQNDKRLKMIALSILNYVKYMAKEFNVDLKNLKQSEIINLIPIFEYIAYNNIELYDFSKIDVADVDVTKKEDLERFVLTHIYYITQPRGTK